MRRKRVSERSRGNNHPKQPSKPKANEKEPSKTGVPLFDSFLSWQGFSIVITMGVTVVLAVLSFEIRLLYVAAFIFSIGLFILSHLVIRKVQISRGNGIPIKWGIRFAAVLISTSIWICVHRIVVSKTDPNIIAREAKKARVLQPANETMKTEKGELSPRTDDRVYLYAGKSLFELKGAGSLSIVKFQDKPLLQIEQGTNGIFVSGEFKNKNGDVVATVVRNDVISNNDEIIDVDRGIGWIRFRNKQNEVLEIRYPNKSYFTISGIIRCPDGTEVVLEPSFFRVNGGEFSNINPVGARTVIQIGNSTNGAAVFAFPELRK